jgi:hypothetical protein
MEIYVLPVVFAVLGIANFMLLWRERPASGVMGLMGFAGLALVSTSWLDPNPVPSALPLSIAAGVTAGISL